MKLTVIGKYGPYPAKGGRTSCYLLQTTSASVALDFGSGAISGITELVPLATLDAVLLSHLHYDHMSDMLPLAYYAQVSGVRPKVYCPFDKSPVHALIAGTGRFELHAVQNGTELQIGDLYIQFCRMEHSVESYAMRITDGTSTLVYTGDMTLLDALLPFCEHADAILMDCCGGAAHCSLADAARVADQTRARIIATHMFPSAVYETDRTDIELAQEGKTYLI